MKATTARSLSTLTTTSTANTTTTTPLVTFRARSIGPKCPFGNDTIEFQLLPGGCVGFEGKSGLGKTTLATVLTGLPHSTTTLRKLDIAIEACDWDPSIPIGERCGVLFQQTTLLDELTVAGNLQVALQQYHHHHHHHHQPENTSKDDYYYYKEIKQLLEVVGLDYDRDAAKRPTELSGGMGRRASLALQLAQHKRVIVLDEPFTGLDYDAAMSVAKELVHIRTVKQTALVLISHEPHLTKVVMDPNHTWDNQTITLQERSLATDNNNGHLSSSRPKKPSLFGTTFRDRFMDRLMDYILYSVPLVGMAFVACGLAISMLSADLLQRLDFQDQVLDLVDTQVRPLIKLLTGQDANAFQMMGVRMKVASLLKQTVPPAKASIFAIGMTKLFVLEIGPLLTALFALWENWRILCGQGGNPARNIPNQIALDLGDFSHLVTFWPSVLAALIASPHLTAMGTAIALGLAGWVGPTHYGIGTTVQFWEEMKNSLFPVLRLGMAAKMREYYNEDGENQVQVPLSMGNILLDSQSWDLTVTYPPRYRRMWIESMIEIVTYPPIYHVMKSIIFIGIILGVAEGVTQWCKAHLTPRGIPVVITTSVVCSGLLVILADWGFSQLWLFRY